MKAVTQLVARGGRRCDWGGGGKTRLDGSRIDKPRIPRFAYLVMIQPHSDIGRQRQRDIYIAGVGGQRPSVPVASAELERAAQAAMAPGPFAYLAGGAGRAESRRR